jgi:hypothetical protein
MQAIKDECTGFEGSSCWVNEDGSGTEQGLATSAAWRSCTEISFGSEQCCMRQSLFSRSLSAGSSLDSFKVLAHPPALCFMLVFTEPSIGVGETARWIFCSKYQHLLFRINYTSNQRQVYWESHKNKTLGVCPASVFILRLVSWKWTIYNCSTSVQLNRLSIKTW